MSRSIKNLYPNKYEEYKNSEHYKFLNKNQVEINTAKEICKKSANYICACCGAPGKDAHHIVFLRDGGTNDQKNLICLCRACHERVHKNVYIIDPETKEIKPNIELNTIAEADKQEYVAQYEAEFDRILYKSTGGYYYFSGTKKVKITAKEIKEAVGFQSATQLRGMLPEKKQAIAEKKILTEWKKFFKESGNKLMWHQLSKVIRLWETLDIYKKAQIFEKLNTNWPNFAEQLSEDHLN
jgi:5-methylcytosine-specific restriction endonuclease McrA